MTEAQTKIEAEYDRSKLGKVLGEMWITVSEEVILRYSKAIGETDPKYTKPGPNLIAPPGIVTVLEGPSQREQVKFPFAKTSMHGGSAVFSNAPIRAGDKLRVTIKLADVYIKTGRSGAMGFVIHENEFIREDGTVVARMQDTYLARP